MSLIESWWLQGIWERLVPAGDSFAATFFPRVAPGSTFVPPGGYALTHVKRRPGVRRTLMDGGVSDSTATFLVWADDLTAAGAPVPKVDDKLTVDSETWLIGSVDQHLFEGVHICEATRAR